MVEKRLPKTIEDALRIRQSEEVIPYFGGTDLMVRGNRTPNFLFLNQVAEIKELQIGDIVRIGAGVTYKMLVDHPDTPSILREIVLEIASPALRNMASVIGNVCNASPVGDTLPYFYAMDAVIELRSVNGTRQLPIAEFIKGARVTDLKSDELVTAISFANKNFNNTYYQKVGPRKACSISKVDFVGLALIEDGVVQDLRMVFGAVKDTIVRLVELETAYKGKTTEELRTDKEKIAKAFDSVITPLNDRRSTESYRRQVVKNLVLDFIDTLKTE